MWGILRAAVEGRQGRGACHWRRATRSSEVRLRGADDDRLKTSRIQGRATPCRVPDSALVFRYTLARSASTPGESRSEHFARHGEIECEPDFSRSEERRVGKEGR